MNMKSRLTRLEARHSGKPFVVALAPAAWDADRQREEVVALTGEAGIRSPELLLIPQRWPSIDRAHLAFVGKADAFFDGIAQNTSRIGVEDTQ